MIYLLAVVLVVLGAWIIAEPFRRQRQAEREGKHGLPFPRMLTRMVAAGCVAAIGFLVAMSPWLLEGRSRLAELLYWLAALLLALVLGVAGVTEMQLVRRDYLIELRKLYRELPRSLQEIKPSQKPQKPGGNGKGLNTGDESGS
jgi:putative Mn2+ efflux pump MntP